MPREVERSAGAVLSEVCGPALPTPAWLVRPGKVECGDRWELVQDIYHRLTGLDLPDVTRSVERRTADGVFELDGRSFVFELDETQHFNAFRATTLRMYPAGLLLAFDKQAWIRRCDRKTRLEGGGFAAPKPPLFPGDNGRHKQRAFRDALCDILPPEHGFLPTLRVGDFEVGSWIDRAGATERMEALVTERLAPFLRETDWH